MNAWNGLVAEGAPEAGTAYFPEGVDILELVGLAWKLEEGSCRFYRESAGLFSDPDAANLVTSLVTAEDRHKKSLEELARRISADRNAASPVGDWGAAPADVMEGGMSVSKALSWAHGRKLTELLELTISLESNAYDLYLKMASRAEDAAAQDLFRLLADEERVHLNMLAGLLEKKLP